MIDLYTYSTFNGRRISIALEELELDYHTHIINLRKGEHKKPAYLAINPSGRIPAIVDHTSDSDSPVILTQSTAILLYLAEKCGQLLPKSMVPYAKTVEWLSFHATDIAPTLFNVFYLNSIVETPQPKAAELLRNRAIDFYRFFDQQLQNNTYLAGDDYSIADIAAYPAISTIQDNLLDYDYQHIHRWFTLLSKRPAIIRGMQVPD